MPEVGGSYITRLEFPMAIYMKYGDIKGEVTADGYKDLLHVDSVGYGVSRPSHMESGAGQGKRHVDACTVSDIQISRASDKASPLLFNEACGGEPVAVEIDFTKTDKKKLVTYLKYKLKDVLISSYSQSGGEGGASESLSMNFMEIEIIHTPFGADGKGGTPAKGKFNVAEAKVG